MILLVIPLNSCRHPLAQSVRGMIGCEVKFSYMEPCLDGYFSEDNNIYHNDSAVKLVVYLDSTQCQICRLNNLEKYHEYIKLDKSNDQFDFIIILSPPKDDYLHTKFLLNTMRLNHRVYLDSNQEFLFNNKFIPSDKRFHTFLLDMNNQVVIIGDPIGNQKLCELISRYLRENITMSE